MTIIHKRNGEIQRENGQGCITFCVIMTEVPISQASQLLQGIGFGSFQKLNHQSTRRDARFERFLSNQKSVDRNVEIYS
jgi:hypothetical protein